MFLGGVPQDTLEIKRVSCLLDVELILPWRMEGELDIFNFFFWYIFNNKWDKSLVGLVQRDLFKASQLYYTLMWQLSGNTGCPSEPQLTFFISCYQSFLDNCQLVVFDI